MKKIKINYKLVLLIAIIYIFNIIPLPYYIDGPGGIENVEKSVGIDGYEYKGSLNLVYVKEYRANIPLIIFSLLNKDYDIIKKKDVLLENEKDQDYEKRDKYFMDESISNAIYVAYTKANKKTETIDNNFYVLYNYNKNSNIELYDSIKSINNILINEKEDILNIIKENKTNDIVKIEVEKDNKVYTRYAKITADGKLGILLSNIRKYKTEPKIKILNRKNVSGPSGGFITSLYMYNSITEKDIIKGRKIIGTGTIELDGTVGEIGGIKYKLKSAVKNNADIFFVPSGKNCKQAMNIKSENKYRINIVCISKFDEAIEYLNNAK